MKRITRSAPHSTRDKATVDAAIQSAWLLLLRSFEYCFVNGGTHDFCLRLGDVAFYDGEKKELAFRDAQKAVTMSFVIRGSKADQARVGCIHRLNRTGLEIDAVEAVANMLQSRSDEWLGDLLRPLFELESGRAVSGSRISKALKLGASDLAPDSRRYATDSLRRGGVTAMAAAGIPTEVIRRWG